MALPPPSLGSPESTPVSGSIKVTDVDIATRTITHPGLHGITVQYVYPLTRLAHVPRCR